MGSGISRQDVSPSFKPLPDEVLEHLFTFLSVHELLMAASVCNSWRIEAFRAIRKQTKVIYLKEAAPSPSTDLILTLASLQKKYNDVKVMISGNWLNTICSKNRLMPKWVERRRLADALCTFQEFGIDGLTSDMAEAFFSALARCRTVELKLLVLYNATLRPGLVARGLLRVQHLIIGALNPVNTTILLLAISQHVGQLKTLVLGCNTLFPVGVEVETVAKALNQVEVLSLDLRGHTSFRDYLCLKATLKRLATSGESNLKGLKLKNLDNSLTRNTDPDLWVEAVSALDFFSLQVNTFNLNSEGQEEDSFGMEVQDIMGILVTVPGERMDRVVRMESGEERHFHIHPFGSCPENCSEFSV